MLRDDDLVDDDFQGRAYDPFLPSRTRGARRPVSSPGTGKWTAAFVGTLALGGAGVHFVALAAYSSTVAHVALATTIGALLPCAFPRTAWIGGLLFPFAGFGLVVGPTSYFVHGV